MKTLQEQAKQILDLSIKMLTAAQEPDMTLFNQLSEERELLIKHVEQLSFEALPADDDTQAARELLVEAKNVNDQLNKMMKEIEQGLLDSKHELKKGKKMKKAYGANR